MVKITPAPHKKIVKKTRITFFRHQSKKPQFPHLAGKNLKWRKPKGIDSCFRRRFKGCGTSEVKIGYGSDKETRNLLPNGFYKFVVHNVSELELLLMHNKKYAAEVASNVSARKRKDIVSRAEQLNIKVLNGHARIRTEESE